MELIDWSSFDDISFQFHSYFGAGPASKGLFDLFQLDRLRMLVNH